MHEPTPETRLSMSSGRVGGETHSEVADMAVAVDEFWRETGRVMHHVFNAELQATAHLERTQ